MPIIKRFDDSYEFAVDDPETTDDFGMRTYVFLKQHICVEEEYTEDEEFKDNVSGPEYFPIIEHPTMGLCYWKADDSCWAPFGADVQRGYSDYLAEKELLENPKPKKKAGSK